MAFLLGPNLSRRLHDQLSGVVWLSTSPLVAQSLYPLAIDVAESLGRHCDSTATLAIQHALAPSWTDFASSAFDSDGTRGPSWNDFEAEDEDITELFLNGALARVVASLGATFGIIIRAPHKYDYASQYLVSRLIAHARITGFHVALEASTKIHLHPDFADDLGGFENVAPPRAAQFANDWSSSQAARMVALSPHGVPHVILDRLGLRSGNASLPFVKGPEGLDWAFLPKSSARKVLSQIEESDRIRLLQELYDVWPTGNWGYLRRAGLAVMANDARCMMSQHARYLQGAINIGRDYLFRQYAALGDCLWKTGDCSPQAVAALVGAARLSKRLRNSRSLTLAKRNYGRALNLVQEPATRVALYYELANLHATTRRLGPLAKARKIYAKGFRCLKAIEDPEVKTRSEITLLNGLALVEYHEHHDEAALELENQALSLVHAASNSPALQKWAKELLYVNTAKLLEKRFGDKLSALGLLEQIASDDDNGEASQWYRVDLARLNFDLGNYQKVVSLLEGIYLEGHSIGVNEKLEARGRILLCGSLLILGRNEDCAAQLKRLRYLNSGQKTEAKVIVDKIEQFVNEASPNTASARNESCRRH